MDDVMQQTERKRLYEIDYGRLKVDEYDVVKETPRRYECTRGGLGEWRYHLNKYSRWGGPNANLFTDPLKALEALEAVIAKEIDKLKERQRYVEEQRQAILAAQRQNP